MEEEKDAEARGSVHDLIVIGGGPAGTSAAIAAARAGARVLLLERGRFPRHKVCGEFVSAESLELLGGSLPSASLLADAIRIPEARIFLDGRVVRAPIEPQAASIARYDLDEALWKSAIDSGVEARDQATVQKVAGQGPFRVTTPSEEFASRALINATGRWSRLFSKLENQSGREKWLGVKAHFAEPSPHPSVDLYFFEGGYCGVQPLSLGLEDEAAGSVNACAMVRADVASSLQEVVSLHPALRERSAAWRPLSEPVSTSPLIFRQPEALEGNMLRAGDAAGFVDPFVGDGISLALRSGSLAVQALLPFFQQQMSLSEAATRYRQNYERQLAPVFRNSSRIRQGLALARPLRAPALFLLQNVPVLARQLVRMTR